MSLQKHENMYLTLFLFPLSCYSILKSSKRFFKKVLQTAETVVHNLILETITYRAGCLHKISQRY